ncbi:hypothetical protein [Streptomyces sp. NPDC101249]|uniref:hypothetical protein n=1 Tax=Streptomyces sp. NPDC101249 TaxID=3366140 RepID=UPI003802435C
MEPGAVRPLFPADFAGTGEELGFLNGGVLAGVRQVLAPSTRLYTLDLLLVSNIRDLEQSDYSGAEEILGARPFPAATAPDKTAVLELLASGPQALDWTAARQRWALEQVRLSMAGRSIATVTTEGQRRPADVALARVVDSSGKILARGLLVIDGHAGSPPSWTPCAGSARKPVSPMTSWHSRPCPSRSRSSFWTTSARRYAPRGPR